MLEISLMYFSFIITVELPQLVSSLLSQTENQMSGRLKCLCHLKTTKRFICYHNAGKIWINKDKSLGLSIKRIHKEF